MNAIRNRYVFVFLAALGLVLAVVSKMYVGPYERYVRGNLDDVFIVHAVYFTLRATAPRMGSRLSALAVLALATTVELFQAVGIFSPRLTGAAGYWFGQYFDLLDMVAYALGAITSVLIERFVKCD